MLQNRVDPFGQIIQTKARGAWMGNRGVIHNHDKEIIAPFKHKAWITCLLEFKGRHRAVMTPNRWTELFFLDEATAFAAGHRPCFECRREDAKRFKSAWIEGNPHYGFTISTSIAAIDDILHRERIDEAKNNVVHQRHSSQLVEGTFIVLYERPYLFSGGELHPWTPFGYETRIELPNVSLFTVLTPNSIVNALQSGYRPQVAVLSI